MIDARGVLLWHHDNQKMGSDPQAVVWPPCETAQPASTPTPGVGELAGGGGPPVSSRAGKPLSLRAPGLNANFPSGGRRRGAPDASEPSGENEQKSKASGQAGTLGTLKEANQQMGELKHKALRLALGAQRRSLLFVT